MGAGGGAEGAVPGQLSYKYNRSREEAEEESFSQRRRLLTLEAPGLSLLVPKGPQDPERPGPVGGLRGGVQWRASRRLRGLPTPSPFGLAQPKSTKRDPKGRFDPFYPLPPPKEQGSGS